MPESRWKRLGLAEIAILAAVQSTLERLEAVKIRQFRVPNGTSVRPLSVWMQMLSVRTPTVRRTRPDGSANVEVHNINRSDTTHEYRRS
jgi:hypothetical protein